MIDILTTDALWVRIVWSGRGGVGCVFVALGWQVWVLVEEGLWEEPSFRFTANSPPPGTPGVPRAVQRTLSRHQNLFRD